MRLRRRSASFVVLLAAIHLVTTVGCTTGQLQPAAPDVVSHRAKLDRDIAAAAQQAQLRRLPSVSNQPIALSSYTSSDPLYNNLTVSSRPYFNDSDVDIDDIVRGQENYHGPLKDFMLNPIVIGCIILAGIIIPLAVDNRNRPVGRM